MCISHKLPGDSDAAAARQGPHLRSSGLRSRSWWVAEPGHEPSTPVLCTSWWWCMDNVWYHSQTDSTDHSPKKWHHSQATSPFTLKAELPLLTALPPSFPSFPHSEPQVALG